MIFLNYLFEVSICLVALYVVYHFLLHQEKLLLLNRGYLLFTLAISFVIPLLQVSIPQQTPEYILLYMPQDAILPPSGLQTSPSTAYTFWNWENIVLLLYCTGLLITLIRFLTSFNQIIHLLKNGQIKPYDDYQLVLVEQEIPVFSFFNYVFLYKNHLKYKHNLFRTNRDIFKLQKHHLFSSKEK